MLKGTGTGYMIGDSVVPITRPQPLFAGGEKTLSCRCIAPGQVLDLYLLSCVRAYRRRVIGTQCLESNLVACVNFVPAVGQRVQRSRRVQENKSSDCSGRGCNRGGQC